MNASILKFIREIESRSVYRDGHGFTPFSDFRRLAQFVLRLHSRGEAVRHILAARSLKADAKSAEMKAIRRWDAIDDEIDLIKAQIDQQDADCEFKLPVIFDSCAHPQSVWFETHWRPMFDCLHRAYDTLKIKLRGYESGDTPTWRSEFELSQIVCEELDRENTKLRMEIDELKKQLARHEAGV